MRQALAERRVGHTGTLDPFATGVLVLCIGRATRLARFLGAGEKWYEAEIGLGYATATDDVTGAPLGEPRRGEPTREAVAAACRQLEGDVLQIPPAFSAKRTAGVRDYERARLGQVVAARAVPVTIHELRVVVVAGDRVELFVRCSSGTYVRSIARDLGERLGTGGHLTRLRRVRSGAFGVEEALSLDALERSAHEQVRPLSALLLDMPRIGVVAAGYEAIRHGRGLDRRLVVSGFPEGMPAPRYRVVSAAGDLLALAVPRGFEAVPPSLHVEPVLHPDVVLVE